MNYINFKSQFKELEQDFQKLKSRLNISDKINQLEEYNNQMSQPSFWQKKDKHNPHNIQKQADSLRVLLDPWLELEQLLINLDQQLEIFKQLLDDKFSVEIEKSLSLCQQKLRALKQQLRFTDKYDDYEVVLSIYAGAGGTDAQDWVAILLRMYIRWAEKHNIKAELISQSSGEEAGFKSISLHLKNYSFLYGRLKHENGVHRLVRLSPFNANNLRQTSFAQVEVIPFIQEDQNITIDDKDLRFDYFKSGGAGGQGVNTTDSAVRVTHVPTKLVVSIQNERSQIMNKQLALNILKSKLRTLKIKYNLQTIKELKGEKLPNQWGSQVRNYVLHPYKQVKDLRSGYVSNNIEDILNGDIDDLITAIND